MKSRLTLFDTTKIKNLSLKNRFIKSALWMKMANEDGGLNSKIIRLYEELAKGGVGLIITGYANISEEEQPNPRMLGIYEDRFIEEYRNLVNTVHIHGSRIALQIVYGGSQNHHPRSKDMKILGPSAVKNRVTGITPKEATKDELGVIVRNFGEAAARAKAAGFDAIQLHAAHGYFLSQFLTPFYNRRTDEYGGSIHNRARIIYEVINEVRRKVGENFPIMIKLNFDDFMEAGEGLIMEEALEVFTKVDELGVDMIEVSAVNESSGMGLSPARTGIKSIEKQSYFREATKRIADIVAAKVILMGGNRDLNLMDTILNQSEIEYFSIARPLLCEPDLINQWNVDKSYVPNCISCNRCWETQPNTCKFRRLK